MYKSLYGHMPSFLFGKHLGVQWLGYMVDVCLTFKEIAKMFSKVIATLAVPTSRVLEFQLLLILNSIWYS